MRAEAHPAWPRPQLLCVSVSQTNHFSFPAFWTESWSQGSPLLALGAYLLAFVLIAQRYNSAFPLLDVFHRILLLITNSPSLVCRGERKAPLFFLQYLYMYQYILANPPGFELRPSNIRHEVPGTTMSANLSTFYILILNKNGIYN